jgi:tripartite-type tricarboxylate transporter receptor subunit TctC
MSIPMLANNKKRRRIMRKIKIFPWAVCFILGLASLALGADYPTRSITLINPMPPGGTLDLQGRAFASVAEKMLGQPMVVVNKPGATGMIGGLAGAQAAPDGYTLTVGSVNLTNAIEWEIANGRKPPFTRHDFIPICSFTLSPTLLIVHPESPWKNLTEFMNDARSKPGQIVFCSGGLYGMSHLPIEIFAQATGLKFRHVPYAGGGPCLSAVVGKHVDFGMQYPPTSLPLMRGNKLKVLAVVGKNRLKSIPDIPAMKDVGIDAEYYGWVGVMAPQKTPQPIVDKLREVAKKVAADKAFIDLIEKPGDEVHFIPGEEFAKYWDRESEKIAKVQAELAKEAAKK